jgi:hypothetical protein
VFIKVWQRSENLIELCVSDCKVVMTIAVCVYDVPAPAACNQVMPVRGNST